MLRGRVDEDVTTTFGLVTPVLVNIILRGARYNYGVGVILMRVVSKGGMSDTAKEKIFCGLSGKT